MLVPNPNRPAGEYRYGFQGQEMDNEIKGEGNSLNYTFRMHDPRVGRFFATDPLENKYPWYSPYQFAGNKVIQYVELEGLEEGIRMPMDGSADLKGLSWAEFKKNPIISGTTKGLRHLSSGKWWKDNFTSLLKSTANMNGLNGFEGSMEEAQMLSQASESFKNVVKNGDVEAMTQFTVEFVGTAIIMRKLTNNAFVARRSPLINQTVKLTQAMEGAEDWALARTGTGEFLGTAQVEKGVLEMHITVPETLRNQGILNKVINVAVEKWNPSKIKGVWEKNFNKSGAPSTNYTAFIKALKSMNPEKAVFQTPTGKAARNSGYGGKPVIEIHNDRIEVIFTKTN